jgi:AbrB family looped-hinge helix DNA binding protein
MIEESKISRKGQITIPKDIRKKMGLKAGDKVVFESFAEGILIRKKEESDYQKILDDIVGIWEDHPLFKDKTTREVIETMRGPDDDTKQQ